MTAKNLIYDKLEQFIKKFYYNELVKGLVLFLGLGLLYLLFTSFIEYFFWLKPAGRTLLFVLFVGVVLFLLGKFILVPVFELFKLKKGLNYHTAAKIIGNHFTDVQDKLINFLQLSEQTSENELLLASIEQKAQNLSPIPFQKAIDYSKSKKYLPLLAVPVLIIAAILLSNKSDMLFSSMNRVVNYNQNFSPPAPFQFVILNENLQTEQNKNFTIKVSTRGSITPEKAFIENNGVDFLMTEIEPGVFEYLIEKPKDNVPFKIKANGVISNEMVLKVIKVPTIQSFDMVLNYPAYLGKKAEIIKGSGHAIVPEGTQITWKINALATDEIVYSEDSQIFNFKKNNEDYLLSKNVSKPFDYEIKTSNAKVKNYETLAFSIQTQKDQHPLIQVNLAPDSLRQSQTIYIGQISDDYGLTRLDVVYYPKNQSNQSKRKSLTIKNKLADQFVYVFPQGLNLEKGISYEYYFEVFDNDAVNKFKSSKSQVYSDRLLTDEEDVQKSFEEKNQAISGMSQALKNRDKQMSEIDKLEQLTKQKGNLEFKDQQKIQDFINRQKQQEDMMKDFSKKIKENLQKTNKNQEDPEKKDLEKRLENAEKQAEKNKDLLNELEKLSEKLQDEQLVKKLDEVKNKAKNQTKNLAQLLELTKRYYIDQKMNQMADKLEKLADQQDELSKKDAENNENKQDQLNKAFDKIKEEFRQLEKDNKDLKRPKNLPTDKNEENSIKDQMEKAKDDLKKNKSEEAKPKQKDAAKKMKKMAEKMKKSTSAGGGGMEQMQEDLTMIRQIIDNLLAFSFSQEDLMKSFKSSKQGDPDFANKLIRQQNLKQQFRHIDDSLFAMSLRNPKITEKITEEIGLITYHMDKALAEFPEMNVSKGVSHQQFVMNSANKLGDYLSNVKQDMQDSMSEGGAACPNPGMGEGQGKGKGMQLPDIIKKMGEMGEKMEEKMNKPGEDGDEGEDGKDKKGNKGKDGKDGKDGQKGDDGKDGQKGDKGNQKGGEKGGKQGNSGSDGENNARELMEMFQQQQKIRKELENLLRQNGLTPDGKKILDQMKDAEKQLLNKGFKNEVLNKVLNIKHQLMKLEKAIQKQDEDDKRQSESNKKEFTPNQNPIPPALQNYINSIENLNKQSLPLHQKYQEKVKEYFSGS